MYQFTKRPWLAGVALSGIFLAGSVLTPAASQAMIIHPITNPAILGAGYVAPNIFPLLSTVMTTSVETKHTQLIKLAQVAISRTNQPVIKQVSREGSTASTIVEHALSFVGAPYVFGGTTKKGFDCSGFSQYVFAESDISIPRTSYVQFASGVAVSKNNLLPGDLVFFTTYAKGASHVGIYVGGGRFVHADNPHVGVTVTSLSNSYYSSHYLGARRYF